MQLRMTPDGSRFYASWLDEGEDGSDIVFRRIMPSTFPANVATAPTVAADEAAVWVMLHSSGSVPGTRPKEPPRRVCQMANVTGVTVVPTRLSGRADSCLRVAPTSIDGSAPRFRSYHV